MIVTVAPTGAVPSKKDNESVPLTPDEIVRDSVECLDAGASVVHVHVRDDSGAPVHRRDLYERVIGGIRGAHAGAVICVTTSSRVGSELDARMTGLDLDGDLAPDMASLTLGSTNFPNRPNVNPPGEILALLDRMVERDVRPELEVFELGMVNTLHHLRARGALPDPIVVNVLLGSLGSAPAFVGDLAAFVDRLPVESEWAAAGVGMFQRPMVMAGAVMGGNIRTGLEDNPKGHDDGTGHASTWTNADAVRFAVEAAELAGRTIATTDETRKRFGLRPSW
jgi:uncharacterized protein (DUF849 family)